MRCHAINELRVPHRGHLLLVVAWLGVTASAEPAASDSTEEIAALVQQLGDADYAVRETASARLSEIGPAAADALLAAAEVSDDLEVALRAKWLADALPLTAPDDPPEVTALLEPFAKGDLGERAQIMHRLLRLDDDAGIEALARIVRLERTPTGSRIAAALLAREWQANDRYWGGIAPRIIAGLGPSERPAAVFLRGLVAATVAASPEKAARGIDGAAACIESLNSRADARSEALPELDGDSTSSSPTTVVFRRCLAEFLARAGRREEALDQAAKLLESSGLGEDGDDSQVATDVQWLASHGLPEAVDLVASSLTEGGTASPLLQYAAAVAWRARGGPASEQRAGGLATSAALELKTAGDVTPRLQAAMLLAKWGADDWAEMEYRSLLDDRESPRALRALTAVLASEFFHDRLRHAEAAAVLARELEDRGKEDDIEAAFMQIERDPQSVKSRRLYFSACAAGAAGDGALQRQQLEASLRQYPKDVDTLIALYRLADNTPAQKAEATARVTKALAAIDQEIQALPDDPNCRNEYAWLVANTEGDVTRAMEFSRGSLEKSFDSASYLDTLAHCHAAAGHFDRAVRTQLLAIRQEPHSQTIHRNLARFEALAAKATQRGGTAKP